MDKRIVMQKDDNYDKNIGVCFFCISVFALLTRVAVSLHPYSGAGNPPKYGDLEAQRHWMEITLSLLAKEWYRNSSTNDLSYWEHDYPPLAAYQSYVHGLLLKSFYPDSVSFYTSRGHESYLFFVLSLHVILDNQEDLQYNCISLGLTVGAIAAILSGKDLVGSILFSLALNHKQMSAYFAPVLFSHLLGNCIRHRNPFLEVLKLGLVVSGTFAVVLWPYLHSLDDFLEVLSGLAPFERGIYEDYVDNFWGSTSILIKLKRLFTTRSLKLLSLCATVLTCLPCLVRQIRDPSNKSFLLSPSSLNFSFQVCTVHEKSILPASLLALEEASVLRWLTQYICPAASLSAAAAAFSSFLASLPCAW